MRRRRRKTEKTNEQKVPRTLTRRELDRVDGSRSANQWIETEIWQSDTGG